MTTSSARPRLLIGYATRLESRVSTCADPLARTAASVAAFDATSPQYAVGSGPLVLCELVLRDLVALAGQVERTGQAFLRAGGDLAGFGLVSTPTLSIGPPPGISPLAAAILGPSAAGDGWGTELWKTTSDAGSTRSGYVETDDEGLISFGPRFEHEFGLVIEDGELVASAEADVFFGVVIAGDTGTEIGPVGIHGEVDARLGVGAAAAAEARLGPDGVELEAGAWAYAGARAEAETSASLGPTTATASAHGIAGLEAGADAEATVSLDEISFDASAGLAVGLGGGIGLSVKVEPRKAVESLVDYGWSRAGRRSRPVGPLRGRSPLDRFVDKLDDLLPG